MAEKKYFPLFAILVIIGIIAGAFFVLSVVRMIFNISTNTSDNDIRNWVSLTIESSIGIFISMMVLYYDKLQQKKFEEQQDSISQLVNDIKKIEEKQEYILHSLFKDRNEKQEFVQNRCWFYLLWIQKDLIELKSLTKNPGFITGETYRKERLIRLSQDLQKIKQEYTVDLSPRMIENIELIMEEIQDLSLELLSENPDINDDILEYIENFHEEMILNQKNIGSKEPIKS